MTHASTSKDHKRVLVTGAASGIGAATARLLGLHGYVPVVTDINPAWKSSGLGREAIVWPEPLDIRDDTAVNSAVSRIESEHGPLSGLVNAAGILGQMQAPDQLKLSTWDREIAVDLRGTFVMCRAVGSRMAKRGSGAIVNVASVAGSTSAPLHGYGPAKAAVISLTKNLASEWGPQAVRVNSVSPGFTNTEALRAGVQAGALETDRLTRNAAMRRLVEPDEIAEVISFLLSPAASGITGTDIPVDAGFLCGVTWDTYGGLRDN